MRKDIYQQMHQLIFELASMNSKRKNTVNKLMKLNQLVTQAESNPVVPEEDTEKAIDLIMDRINKQRRKG